MYCNKCIAETADLCVCENPQILEKYATAEFLALQRLMRIIQWTAARQTTIVVLEQPRLVAKTHRIPCCPFCRGFNPRAKWKYKDKIPSNQFGHSKFCLVGKYSQFTSFSDTLLTERKRIMSIKE